MDRNRRSDVMARHDVMTPTDAHDEEPVGFEKTYYLRS